MLRAQRRIEQLEASVYSRWYSRSFSVYTSTTNNSTFLGILYSPRQIRMHLARSNSFDCAKKMVAKLASVELAAKEPQITPRTPSPRPNEKIRTEPPRNVESIINRIGEPRVHRKYRTFPQPGAEILYEAEPVHCLVDTIFV